MDIVIELLLLAQIVFGLWIALGYRWGYYWFASDMSPYLWSIVKFGPQIDAVSAMPWVIKTHIVGAFIILGMIPFTRLGALPGSAVPLHLASAINKSSGIGTANGCVTRRRHGPRPVRGTTDHHGNTHN